MPWKPWRWSPCRGWPDGREQLPARAELWRIGRARPYNTRPRREPRNGELPVDTDRSVAQSGRAPSSGGGGRRFKSGHSDQFNQRVSGYSDPSHTDQYWQTCPIRCRLGVLRLSGFGRGPGGSITTKEGASPATFSSSPNLMPSFSSRHRCSGYFNLPSLYTTRYSPSGSFPCTEPTLAHADGVIWLYVLPSP